MAKRYRVEMLPTTLQPGYVVVVREVGNKVLVKEPGAPDSSAWKIRSTSLPGFVPGKKPAKKARKKAAPKKAKKKVTRSRKPRPKVAKKKTRKKARRRRPPSKVSLGPKGKRIYLQGVYLLQSKFEIGGDATVVYDENRDLVAILADPDPMELAEDVVAKVTRVSRKQLRGEEVPVIDIQNEELKRIFGGAKKVALAHRDGMILVTRSQIEDNRVDRERAAQSPRGDAEFRGEVSVYAGAGFLSYAAKQAGARVLTAIEKWRPAVLMFKAIHGVEPLEEPLEEIVAIEGRSPGFFGLPRNVWLMTAGLPCEPFSKAGGKGVRPEDPHELADQLTWLCALILMVNPQNVVIENVPEFVRKKGFSPAGILIAYLKRLGYQVHFAVLSPEDFGYAASRDRAVIVATTEKGFSWPKLAKRRLQTANDVLYPPEHEEVVDAPSNRQGQWFDVRKPKAEIEKRLKAFVQGKKAEYQPTVVRYGSLTMPTVPKSAAKSGGTTPVVQHPEDEYKFRMLTVDEMADLHLLPDEITEFLPRSYADATALIGQGVHVPLFRSIIERLPGGRTHSRTITARYRRTRNPWWR